MPLDPGYGAAMGTLVSFTREDPTSFGSRYHGKLRIETPAGVNEAALDVDTPSGVGVSYRLVDKLSVHQLGPLGVLPSGFTALASTPTSGALDYVRSPLLRDGRLVTWLRSLIAARRTPRRVVLHAHREDFDRPILMERWGPSLVDRLLARLHLRSHPPVASDGNNALDVLEPLASSAARSDASDHAWIWQIKFNTQSLRTDYRRLPLASPSRG